MHTHTHTQLTHQRPVDAPYIKYTPKFIYTNKEDVENVEKRKRKLI